MELANGFEELADAGENRRRMNRENEQRTRCGKRPVPPDEQFFEALEGAGGLPSCSGVAVGLDRVLLCRLGLASLENVLPFGWKDC